MNMDEGGFSENMDDIQPKSICLSKESISCGASFGAKFSHLVLKKGS